MYCTQCGRQLPNGSAFCIGCGSRMAGSQVVDHSSPQDAPSSIADDLQRSSLVEMFRRLPGGISFARVLTRDQQIQLDASEGDPEALISALKSGQPALRARAALSLAAHDHPEIDRALMSALADASSVVRAAAILSLGKRRYEPAHAELTLAGRDKDQMVRSAAAAALLLMRDAAGTQSISNIFQTEQSADVITFACSVIAGSAGLTVAELERRVSSGLSARSVQGELEDGGVEPELAAAVVTAISQAMQARERLRREARSRDAASEQAGRLLKIGLWLIAAGLLLTFGSWCYSYSTTQYGTYTYYVFWWPMALGGLLCVGAFLRYLSR